jgi:hypothetical protein
MDIASGLLVLWFSLAPCVVSLLGIIGIRFGLVAEGSFAQGSRLAANIGLE